MGRKKLKEPRNRFISTRVKQSTGENIDRIAQREEKTVSLLVNNILEMYLDTLKRYGKL
jgi:hypothetical protein